MPLFADEVHEEFSMWLLGFAPYGGADYGEVQALAAQVQAGDDGSFFDGCHALAVRRIDEGDRAVAAGKIATARDCYLRGAAMLGIGYHPLYGTPVDPRLRDAFRLQMATFDKAISSLAATAWRSPTNAPPCRRGSCARRATRPRCARPSSSAAVGTRRWWRTTSPSASPHWLAATTSCCTMAPDRVTC